MKRGSNWMCPQKRELQTKTGRIIITKPMSSFVCVSYVFCVCVCGLPQKLKIFVTKYFDNEDERSWKTGMDIVMVLINST